MRPEGGGQKRETHTLPLEGGGLKTPSWFQGGTFTPLTFNRREPTPCCPIPSPTENHREGKTPLTSPIWGRPPSRLIP